MNFLHKYDKVTKSSLVFITLLFVYATVPARNFKRYDPDAFWHIKLGEYILTKHTVPHTAILSYVGNGLLPYVPQEVGFQVAAGFLYMQFGFAGLRILYVLCIAVLIWGMYKLVALAREETGKTGFPIYLHLVILIVFVVLDRSYLLFRPQMMSTPLTLWYFLWMRKFAKAPSFVRSIPLIVSSFIMANLHAGIWPLLFVFFAIQLVVDTFQKCVTKWHFITLVSTVLIAWLNAGGIHSLTYFFLISDHQALSLINEWGPVDYMHNKFLLLIFLGFLFGFVTTKPQTPFRILFGLALTTLGLVTYKIWLDFLLFVPYFLPLWDGREALFRKWTTIGVIGVGLLSTTVLGLIGNYPIPAGANGFPVQEMTFILHKQPIRPKVLASYNVGGYVIFRGGEDFVDGRFDPFVAKQSINDAMKLEAIYRSSDIYDGYFSVLRDEIRADHPDFFIFPIGRNPSPIVEAFVRQVDREYGQPVFHGTYGDVWDLQSG